MVKGIFFDLTNTLQDFDFDKQWNLLHKLILEETKNEISLGELKKYYQQTYEIYRLGKIKGDFEFFNLVFKQLALNVSKEQIDSITKKHLVIRKQFTSLPDKYAETLTELKKHFKLAIVSSGVWLWAEYDFKNIFGFEMNNHFDLIVNSYEEGYLKDSGKLFEIALLKLNLKANEVAFVGDDYEKDILLAKEHGMKTIFLNKKNEPFEGDITIKKLSDLIEQINAIKRII